MSWYRPGSGFLRASFGCRISCIAIGCAAVVLLQVLLVRAADLTGPTTRPAVEKPNKKTESCSTAVCHTEIQNRKVMHRPTVKDKCLACHEYDEPRHHRFKPVAKEPEMCMACHKTRHRTVVHKPVKDGACSKCHDPHGSKWRKMLVTDPAGGLCRTCHSKDKFAKMKHKHAPVADGACILCHEAHSSWEPKLLVRKREELCQSCHLQVIGGKDKAQARHVHAPMKGGCSECHDPHASNNKYQLRQDTPDLCLSCHEKMRNKLAQAKIVHKVATTPGGCLTCHSPHTSFLPKLQRASQNILCLTCHDKPMKSKDDRVLTDMAALLRNNPNQHRPILTDGCSACHDPHSGELHNLLVKEYPPEFYAPFSEARYALCFSCHRASLVTDKRGVGLTRFRQGESNLHSLHVNREKGRTCRACHEVHASKNDFHMRDKVPFGDSGWLMDINYKRTESGGGCESGCHKLRTYNRQGASLKKKPSADLPADVAKRSSGVKP